MPEQGTYEFKNKKFEGLDNKRELRNIAEEFLDHTKDYYRGLLSKDHYKGVVKVAFDSINDKLK